MLDLHFSRTDEKNLSRHPMTTSTTTSPSCRVARFPRTAVIALLLLLLKSTTTLTLKPVQAFQLVPLNLSPSSGQNRRIATSSSSSLSSSLSSTIRKSSSKSCWTRLRSTASSSSTASVVLPETNPLPLHTFSGMVEHALIEKFGGASEQQQQNDELQRVLTSWRLLEKGYEHDEFVGVTQLHRDPATSQCRQHCHSYVPGLTVREFWDIDQDPRLSKWVSKLQSKYPAILREFQTVTADLPKLQQEGNNIWAGALTEDASSYGEGWKTLVLMDRGHWDPINCNLFPVTAQAVHNSGAPAVEVFFASLQPETTIKPHSDFTNFVLTSHLPLDIPYNGQNKCRLTVGDETRQWLSGQVMVFDTSLIHDAINDSDKMRYILMLRVWHPDLTPTEREALQFTYDCLGLPELVSPDPNERLRAQQAAERMRAFPEIQKVKSFKQGFGGSSTSATSRTTSEKKKRRGRK